MMHNPVIDMRLAMMFLEEGIVPLTRPVGTSKAISVPWHFDINKVLAGMSPEEATTMRRKFRKLWRKAAAALEKRNGRAARQKLRELGFRKGAPAKSQKNSRKAMVFGKAWRQINSEIKLVQTADKDGRI
jgi:hypothetical protein